MVANFSQEEIVLLKATVLGVAEEISPFVVAEINDGDSHRSSPCFVCGQVLRKGDATVRSKYSEYLDGILGHLTRKEGPC